MRVLKIICLVCLMVSFTQHAGVIENHYFSNKDATEFVGGVVIDDINASGAPEIVILRQTHSSANIRIRDIEAKNIGLPFPSINLKKIQASGIAKITLGNVEKLAVTFSWQGSDTTRIVIIDPLTAEKTFLKTKLTGEVAGLSEMGDGLLGIAIDYADSKDKLKTIDLQADVVVNNQIIGAKAASFSGLTALNDIPVLLEEKTLI